jgi:hypothetical protein
LHKLHTRNVEIKETISIVSMRQNTYYANACKKTSHNDVESVRTITPKKGFVYHFDIGNTCIFIDDAPDE